MSATRPFKQGSAPGELTLLLVAVGFLTRVPVPVPAASGYQARCLRDSLRYFPGVGGLIGLAGATVCWLASHWYPRAIAVGLLLAGSLLLTGALHEDGFADACDGFGGGRTREQVLAIMKDSRIGAFGALGLIVLTGLKWSALLALPVSAFSLVVVAAGVASRWCAIGLLWAMPYARGPQAGKSEAFAGGLSGWGWLLSGAIGMAVVVLPAAWPGVVDAAAVMAVAAGWTAAVVSAAVVAAAIRRRIGGYTGDCLGAVQQLCELTFLLGALAVLRSGLSRG